MECRKWRRDSNCIGAALMMHSTTDEIGSERNGGEFMLCQHCGSELSEGAKFCRRCGTKQVEIKKEQQIREKTESFRFCRECGSELSKEAKFCRKCGAKQTEDPLTVTMPEETILKDDKPKKSKPIEKHRQRKGSTLIIGAALLVVIVVAKLLLGEGGNPPVETGKGKREEIETVTVSATEPTVSLAGVTVDVNPLNLSDGDASLTVQRYEEKRSEDGFLGVEYDIDLEKKHYLQAPLKVTLPYDANSAKGSTVCILHYDKDYGEWIPQETELDSESETVSTKLTTLSPLRLVYFKDEYTDSLFYIRDSGHTYARIELRYDCWDVIKNTPLEPARIVAEDYILNGNTKTATRWLAEEGDKVIGDINTYYSMFGALADTVLSVVGTTAEQSGAVRFVTDTTSNGISVVSLTIAATQFMFDVETKDPTDPYSGVATNLYKNFATDAGTLYSFFSGYSSAALSMGFLGVSVTGYVLDSLIEEAETLKEETVSAVFDTYYNEHTSFSEEDMYKMFVDAYWSAWQDDLNSEESMKSAMKKVTDAIDVHAEEFWNVVYNNGDALTFSIAESGKRNNYTPTADQKKELTYRFKKYLVNQFNFFTIPAIDEFMRERIQDEVCNSLWNLAKPYNVFYRVQIQEIAPDEPGATCKYQQSPIRFGSTRGFVEMDYPEEWELLAPEGEKEWAEKLDFTLFGYIQANAPNKVFLFDPWDEEKHFGDQIKTVDLDLEMEDKEGGYITLIDLSERASENLAGSYIFAEGLEQDEFTYAGAITESLKGTTLEIKDDGSFSITGTAKGLDLSEKTGASNDYYKLKEYRTSVSGVNISGNINSSDKKGTATISGSVGVYRLDEEYEGDSGDYWSVEEYNRYISDMQYEFSGTGGLEFGTNYYEEESESFPTVTIVITNMRTLKSGNYKHVYEHLHPRNPEANGSEVRSEKTYSGDPVDGYYSVTYRLSTNS